MKKCLLLLTALLLGTMFYGCGDYDPVRKKLKAEVDQMEAESDEFDNLLSGYFEDKGEWASKVHELFSPL